MRKPLTPAVTPAVRLAVQSILAGGKAVVSRKSGCDRTVSISAQSATVRVIGPICATLPVGDNGHAGTRPNCALIPTRPVKAQGIRIEPPPSVPTVSGPMPAATAAALPPLEPPGVRSVFHGLRVVPVRGESVAAFQPNSGVVVLPSNTAPCSRKRATAGASSFHGPAGSTVREPRSVGQPLVSSKSLIETGTP